MTADGPTRYTRAGDVTIAYRTLPGPGPSDQHLLFSTGLLSHVEVLTENPRTASLLERLSALTTVTLFDRRGTGLSDTIHGPLELAEEVPDVLAVLDAVGAERAVLMGYTSAGPLCVQVAAAHPERVRALVLYACMFCATADGDYDWPQTAEQRLEAIEATVGVWGTGSNLARLAPSAADDEALRAWLGRVERLSCSPGGMRLLSENLGRVDVRPLLGDLRVPTLLLHRTDDQMIDVRHSRYAAEHIPGARFVELPGSDSLPSAGDAEALVGEIEEFLTGGRTRRNASRPLLTVCFTDIVGATGHAARLGDAAWRDKLAEHHAAIRPLIARFGGEEVKTIGDSFLVVFGDAPSQAVRFAAATLEAVKPLGLTLRAGLHTGECERIGSDVGGMAVHIAARVGALAGADEVLASGTTFGTVVGSGLEWEFRGSEVLRGVPGEWPLFSLTPASGDRPRGPSRHPSG